MKLCRYYSLLIVYSAVSVNIAQTDSGNKYFTTSETSDYDLNFSFPPEWESHEAVWVDWSGFANETRIEIIETLHKNVKIKLLTFSDSLKSLAINMMLDAEIDTSQVEIYYHSVPNYFLRDAGPKYLTNGNEYRIADFGWNCFGGGRYDSLCSKRGEIDNKLANQFGIPVVTSDVVVEGGALEVSSSVILAFKEMALERNPDKSLEEIEKVFLDIYGKKKIIWIEKKLLLEKPGNKIDNYFGQGANGHIDDYMRFVNDSTILVGVMDSTEKDNNPVNQIDYYRLLNNLNQIKNETDENGSPFHIIEIPMPDVTPYSYKGPLPEYYKTNYPDFYENVEVGDTIVYVPVMSYLNFFISNGVVLIHKYWEEGIPESEKKKDEYVYETIKKLFPDRKVVQINALPLNWNGGGIHCTTQQVPGLKE